MSGDYTIGAICAPVAVVAVELAVLRTGILRRRRFWATIVITFAFQVAVDGWLTKLSAPIVLYRQSAISGARWPWDIPVEDFGFAFAMVTMTLALWERALRRSRYDPAAGPVMRADPVMNKVSRPAMLAALRMTARGGLAGVWVRGRLPAGPVVWAANHHSWWDPFIAGTLLSCAGRRMVLLADVANVHQYRFARRIGVVGTDELRTALAAVRDGATLVIYPEGRLLAAGPPGPLAAGAAWSAARAPARLCSVAVRVLLRGRQYPEAYVVFSEVDAGGPLPEVTARLHARLRADLGDLDRLSASADPRQPLPGFRRVVRGRRSWDERLDAARGWLPWSPR